jgi:hypothetical protein
MRHLILGLILLPLLTGCDQVSNAIAYLTPTSVDSYVAPCYVDEIIQVDGKPNMNTTNVRGYKHMEMVKDKPRLVSHCIACANAHSRGELQACNGEGQ